MRDWCELNSLYTFPLITAHRSIHAMNEVASRQLGEGPHRTSKIPSELIEHSERRNDKGKGRERSESIESQDEIRKQTER